jgi:hypothetical protein
MQLRKVIFAAIILVLMAASVMAQLPRRYTRYNQALDTLSYLQNIYPGICKLDTLGYSTRDSVPILRFKISDNVQVDEDEPAVFICGGVHADEVLGVETVMWFINDIMYKYSHGDTAVQTYINNLEIFCVPFINPEGHIVVEGGDTDWRKNKCDNDSNGVFDFHDGVDNNRNYDLGWSIDTAQSGSLPESLEYKGTAPFTQTENIAMAAFGRHYQPLFAVDYHSPTYGRSEKAYYNWYWYPSDGGHGFSPDETLMLALCTQFASLMVNDRGDSTYEARRGLVNKGDFKTYFYGNFGTAAFTVELSDTTIQDTLRVDGICSRQLPAEYFLLRRALDSGITGIIRDSVTLEPIQAEVQVVGYTSPDIHPRLSRPDFGRYRRLLAPGSYSLTFIKTGYRTRTVNSVSVVSGHPTTVDKLLPPINPRPPAPLLSYPPRDTTFSDTAVTFIWHRSSYASRYLLELYNLPDSVHAIFIDSLVADTTLTLDSLLTDSLYLWRVKGGNSYGWGPYSQNWRFAFHSTTGIQDGGLEPSRVSLGRNYPNPFNSNTVISFNLPARTTAELGIFDIGGRLVRHYEIAASSGATTSRIIWDGTDALEYSVKSGVYFYQLRASNKTFSNKMILLR